jgi:predicted permease
MNVISALREWVTRAWWTVRGRRRDAELEEELRLHVDLETERQRRAGRSPEEARRAAAIQAGQVPQAMEAIREQRGLLWVEDVQRDLRDVFRALRRNPTFAIVTLLTLAMGIGANTAVFTVVNRVLVRPLAYPHSEDLVAVWHTAPGAPGLASVSGDLRLSPSMYFTYAEQNRTFEAFGVWTEVAMTVTGVAEPEQVRTAIVTDGVLQAFGVPPALGRWLTSADQKPGAPATAIISYGYWQRRFGGDRSIIGRRITVESTPRDIVGVMPAGFAVVDANPDVILPIAFDRAKQILPGFGFQAVARLKPGVTIAAANADIARLVPIWMTSWPAAEGVDPRAYESWRIAPAVRPLKQDVVGNVGDVLWILMAMIGIVMLIACANVASLVLVRVEGRHQELAVRAALGAGRARIARGVLVESVVLGLIGGALGVLLAGVGLKQLVAMGPANLPRLNEISIDGGSIAFTFFLSVFSGVLFGLLPALRYAGANTAVDLRGARTASASKERQRARSVLVVVQVALALVLLVSSGLMIRTFVALRTVLPGFTQPDQVQTIRVSIPGQLVADPERVARTQNDIADKLAAIPGVASVGFASQVFMDPTPHDWDVILIENGPDLSSQIPPLRLFNTVSPGFFRTMGTRILAGRDFTWTDLYERRPGLMISENLARELWGTADAAVGKRVKTLPNAPWREVIGVVEDVRDNGVQKPAPTTVYWPVLGESPYRRGKTIVDRTVTFVIRGSRAGADGFLTEMRQAVWSVNASLPVTAVKTMKQVYDQSMAQTSFALVMLAIAAIMAMSLGIVGIYGVIAYAVSQRRREIAIRVALGAQARELERMFVRDGLLLTATGVMLGLVAAAGLTRLMASLLFGVSSLDPATFLFVPLVMVIATIFASYVPARRATAVDPVEALKTE